MERYLSCLQRSDVRELNIFRGLECSESPLTTDHSPLTMIHILGIRHHGPGSAKNVKEFLETVKPDIVLVEGPPEADPLLQWVNHAELKPPVAILVYQPDDPQSFIVLSLC